MKNDFPYPDFTFNLYTFNLTAQEDLFLPSYKGATFRGAFGYALRKTICTLPGKICQECLLHTTCVYPYIFEPSPETFKINVPKRFQDLPRPFVLRPPRTKSRRILKSSPFNFELVLVGKTTDYLPYFIFTFNELGKFGLGKKRGKFDLIYVTDSVGNQIYDYKTHVIKDTGKVLSWKELVSEWKSPITLNFINPTRLKEEGKLITRPTFLQIIRSLISRISLLSQFYCNQPLTPDVKKLLSLASAVKTESTHLTWYDWGRYSTHQQTNMKLGGFLGKITFAGELGPFLPFLVLGQYLHLGKSCTFGLGQYIIE